MEEPADDAAEPNQTDPKTTTADNGDGAAEGAPAEEEKKGEAQEVDGFEIVEAVDGGNNVNQIHEDGAASGPIQKCNFHVLSFLR